MKMFLISDNIDTTTGFRLAGVDGVVVHTYDEVKEIMDQVLEKPEVGVILITEKLGRMIPETIGDIKLNRQLPLVVEIPDRHGTGRAPDSITRYVREAIGLKI